jgi:hypothetical protein
MSSTWTESGVCVPSPSTVIGSSFRGCSRKMGMTPAYALSVCRGPYMLK